VTPPGGRKDKTDLRSGRWSWSDSPQNIWTWAYPWTKWTVVQATGPKTHGGFLGTFSDGARIGVPYRPYLAAQVTPWMPWQFEPNTKILQKYGTPVVVEHAYFCKVPNVGGDGLGAAMCIGTWGAWGNCDKTCTVSMEVYDAWVDATTFEAVPFVPSDKWWTQHEIAQVTITAEGGNNECKGLCTADVDCAGFTVKNSGTKCLLASRLPSYGPWNCARRRAGIGVPWIDCRQQNWRSSSGSYSIVEAENVDATCGGNRACFFRRVTQSTGKTLGPTTSPPRTQKCFVVKVGKYDGSNPNGAPKTFSVPAQYAHCPTTVDRSNWISTSLTPGGDSKNSFHINKVRTV
jgi:hypothetical protein